ncbi:MAG: hypothetical protein DMF62_07555 [Acidobacteria bacterium]|nr:MAG: hypothetical protein DMF62_07555 [Acidobacteriota bacterium]
MATNYIIEIEDYDGKKFKIITTIPKMPKVGPHRGIWRAFDKGFVVYDRGGNHFVPNNIRYDEGDLLFFDKDYPPFGFSLKKIHNFWGEGDMGIGEMPQDWVINCTPGQFKWKVIKMV